MAAGGGEAGGARDGAGRAGGLSRKINPDEGGKATGGKGLGDPGGGAPEEAFLWARRRLRRGPAGRGDSESDMMVSW